MKGLIETIDHHLMNALVETDSPATVLDDVLAEYAEQLRIGGNVPAQFIDDVLEELSDLALEIIRKRTYGCLTIASFRDRKR